MIPQTCSVLAFANGSVNKAIANANLAHLQNQDAESLLFGRPPKTISTNKADPPKKKAKAVTLKRTTATKKEIAPFINPQYSRPQIYANIGEQDAYELLRNPDSSQTLKGNEWPVYLFMALKAYAWDSDLWKRRDGTRNFATEYVASGTGLSESTAFEVMNRLMVKGFIEFVSTGPEGNVYRVSPVLFYRPDPACPKKPLEDQDSDEEGRCHRKSDTPIRKSETPPTDNRSAQSPIIGEPDHRNSDTIIDSVYLLNSINLSLLESHFDKLYFSSIRAPKVVEEEKEAFRAIVSRNGDITLGVFEECFEVVKRTKDAKGNPIAKVFVWMAGGFDKILNQANARLREKQRKAELSREFESNPEPSPEPSVDLPVEDAPEIYDQPNAGELRVTKN